VADTVEGAKRPALVAESLTVRFGREAALLDVSVEVPAGATVALLGPNGAGKTTLFQAAIGLVRPASGYISLGSRRVAFVPQRLEVEPSFPVTVGDVVRMGRYGDLGWLGRFTDRDRELVADALRELGIEHLADRRFGDLSGGERQRALLAQASAQDAEILLLDEPFAGLDAPTHGALQRLLRDWRDRGRTVLVATHDLESASRDFDLVLCLNRRLIAFGPPAETFTEEVISETFAGRVLRVGSLLVDTAHHHHGAG
jgi:manganese/zinc/iron transport system ATP- binding protein